MNGVSIRDAFVYFVAIVVSITIHEFGHAVMADRLGDPTPRQHGRVTLNPFVIMRAEPVGAVLIPLVFSFMGFLFGYASTPVNLSKVRTSISPRKAEFLVSIAGPMSNVVLFFAASFVHVLVARGHLSTIDGVAHIAKVLVMVNAILAVFNLIPIPPLDGFAIMRSMIPRSGAIEWMSRNGNLLFLILFVGASRIFEPLFWAIGLWFRFLGGL